MSGAILRRYTFTGPIETNTPVHKTAVTDVTNRSMFGLTVCVCTAVQTAIPLTLRTFLFS